MNRQEILEALKNDNYYRNLSDKDFFDANNLDNLAKYLEHNFAKTDESKKAILDMLSHKKHNPSNLYNYRITQEELFNLNKKYYDNTYLYHGLNAYTTNLTDKSLDISEKIENNLYNIINNKDIELATSSTHMIGDIGIKGKGDSLFAQPWDMYSIVDKKTGERSKPRAKTIITEDDIFGIIEKYQENPKRIKPWEKHDEVIAKNFEIESLWVKEDFYNNNQDFVLKLLKDNKIQNLDIIHSNSFEQYYDVDIERINFDNINLKENNIKNLVNQSSIIDTKKPIYTDINKQYQELIDNHWLNTINKHDKEVIEKALPKLNKKYNENYTKPDIYITHNNYDIRKNYLDVINKKNGAEAYLFRQNDILFLNAHGGNNGKILYNKKFIEPKELLNELEEANLIPDDIKKIYTISCYGGLQKPSKTNNGIPIESSHTSNKPILGIPMTNEISFSISEGTGDISENLKKDILRNKDYKVEEVLSPKQIDDVLKNKPKKQSFNFNIDKNGQYYFEDIKLKEIPVETNEEKSIKNIDDNIKGQTSFIDNNGNIKQEYIVKKQNNIKTILDIDINSKKGKEAYKNIALKKNNSYIAGFVMDDSMFIIGHGTKNGGGIIANNKIAMNNKFLGSLLLEENLIPDNVKNIYTISCYGGLQQPIELPNGVKIQSLHNSKQKIKFGLTLDKNNNVSNIKIGVTDNASLVKKFKNNSINVQMSFSPKEFNEAIINNKARHGALTSQEAFNKYGPNDDRFYTSQGLDPKKQKEAINKLNSKHKPPESLPDYSADDARLDKMFAEDKAYIESLEKQRKKPKYKPVKGPKLKETVKQDNNLEKATNEVFDNFTENINNTPKPKVKNTPKPSKNIVKPVKNTSKMTTKSLGGVGKGSIGLIVAGVTGLAIGKVLSSDNDNKDKKQDKRVAKQQNISYNNQYMDNQYTMQMAQDISSYRYGKHMTGFVNY